MDENETTPSRNLSSKERARLAFATFIGAVFGISCMSFSIERNASETAADLQPTIKQRGKLTVNDSQEGIQVYYARPFNSPPNLRLEAGPHNDNIELIVQKADYFTVRLKGTTFAEGARVVRAGYSSGHTGPSRCCSHSGSSRDHSPKHGNAAKGKRRSSAVRGTDRNSSHPPEGTIIASYSTVESVDHVCCRYRLRAFQRGLEQNGHFLELQELPRTWWGRLRIARSLGNADAVILQRKLLSRVELGLLRRRVNRLLFDFDDGVWMRDSYSPKGFDSRKRRARFGPRCSNVMV